MNQPLAVDVTYAEQVFPFQLCERTIQFGGAGHGQYYWMDGRQLRSGQSGPNFRSCVELWWHAVEQAGEAHLPENELNLVLAECYPRVATAKGMQDVFVDAHLHASADREYTIAIEKGVRHIRSERTYMLDDQERNRLQQLAHSRRLEDIAKELDSLFLGQLPDKRHLPAYQQAAQAWIGNGIRALKTAGREGLQHYTTKVDTWLQKLRRRGGQEQVRRFLNIFSYECKVAFYLCYTSAWVALQSWLEQHREPNLLGQRFMSMWHCQNRSQSDKDGIPLDVFRGQVLALHPLSAVVLTSPEHLTVIGKWLDEPDFDHLMATGQVDNCPEYWDVVATILIAAHEYRASRLRWDESRDANTYTNSEAIPGVCRDDAAYAARIYFEDYAVARNVVCLACNAELDYVSFAIADSEEHAVDAQYLCPRCQAPRTVRIEADDAEC